MLQAFSNADVLAANQRLLNSIAAGDYQQYKELCADDMTCFEPESCGLLVPGLEFHKYYFDLGASNPTKPAVRNNITMSNPHIRWLGKDAVVLSYTRMDQVLVDMKPVTKTTSETRIWEIRDNVLVHVHFHKS